MEAIKTETPIPVPPGLTDAQAVVYRLVVQGYTSGDIAKQLSRSEKTVENHRYAINKILRTEGPTALVAYHYELLVLPPLKAQKALCVAACGAIAQNPDCYCDHKRTKQKCSPCIAREALALCQQVEAASLARGEA